MTRKDTSWFNFPRKTPTFFDIGQEIFLCAAALTLKYHTIHEPQDMDDPAMIGFNTQAQKNFLMCNRENTAQRKLRFVPGAIHSGLKATAQTFA